MTTDRSEGHIQRTRVGVLCLNLMAATVDLLNRLAKVGGISVKAFPLFEVTEELQPRFEYRPPVNGGIWVTLNNLKRDAPDVHFLRLAGSAVRSLVEESDVVMLLGLQGPPALYATWLARKRRKPVITVNQGMAPRWEANRPWIIRFLKGWLLRQAEWHIVQTPGARDSLTQIYGIPPQRQIYAPFEAGVSYFKQLYESANAQKGAGRASMKAGKVVFLFVGSLIGLKGVDVLLRAFATLHSISEMTELWLVGDGPAKKELRKLSVDLGIEDSVRFWGFQPANALVDIYLSADVFVLPTRKDMWPKVLAEAALAGLPLITTERCGAANYLVQSQINGFVVSVDDIPGLHDSMRSLLDSDKRSTFGKQSRRIVEEYHDPEAQTAAFVDAIRRAEEA